MTAFPSARLLVVDDEPANVRMVQRVLSNAGFTEVNGTDDSSSVLDLVATLDPDLIVLDLNMPPPDGYAVLAALREQEAVGRPLRPALVLTADATTTALERALGLGARDLLRKPFLPAEILLRIERLLEVRFLHRALEGRAVDLELELARERQSGMELLRAREQVLGVLSGDSISSVYQPIVDLKTGDVVGYEALARFGAEPVRAPDLWFADAATAGLTERLELLAVRTALTALASLPDGIYLSVNLSPLTILSARWPAALEGIPPARVMLEVTEHAPVADYAQLLAMLAGFRAAGGRLAIDDAGAGFASLRHILRLEPDEVKLDISLTRDIHIAEAKQAVAAGIVSFSDRLGMTVVAEGIEKSEEVAALRELGVHYGQGYHLGRPGPLPVGDEPLDKAGA